MLKCVQVACGIVIFLGTALGQKVAPQDWASLDRQAEELYTKGDLKEAIRVATLGVEAASGPKQSGRSLDRLGFFEYTSGNLKDGESHLRRALELRKQELGIDTVDYAESANDLALFFRDSDKLSEARVLAEQAVEIQSGLLGAHNSRVAESLNTLGSILALAGDYDLYRTPGDEWRYYLVSGMSSNMTSQGTFTNVGPFLVSTGASGYTGFTIAPAVEPTVTVSARRLAEPEAKESQLHSPAHPAPTMTRLTIPT